MSGEGARIVATAGAGRLTLVEIGSSRVLGTLSHTFNCNTGGTQTSAGYYVAFKNGDTAWSDSDAGNSVRDLAQAFDGVTVSASWNNAYHGKCDGASTKTQDALCQVIASVRGKAS